MTEISNIRKAKYSSLKKAFQNLGYNISNEVDQKELLLFLNKRTSSGNFDPILGKKLVRLGKEPLKIKYFAVILPSEIRDSSDENIKRIQL